VKKILNIALAASFFHAPILVMSSLLGLHIGGVQIGLSILAFNIFLKFCSKNFGKIKKLCKMDVWVIIYFLAFVPSIIFTSLNNGSIFSIGNAIESGLMFVLAYFFIRMAWVADYRVDFIIVWLLKISCVWIVVEFIVVNAFDLAPSIEGYLNPIFNSARLYDGFLGKFVKAAGPIPGPQNASVIAVIACFVFAYAVNGSRENKFRLWLAIAIIAFMCSFTLTGLIIALTLASIKFRYGVLIAAVVFIIGEWDFSSFGWMDYLLAIKNGNSISENGHFLDYINYFGVDQFSRVFDLLQEYPFGLGWAEREYDSNQSGVNQEIYVIRLIALGGVGVLIALTFFIFNIFSRIMFFSPSQEFCNLNNGISIVFILSIIISTIHYPTFSVPSVAIIFAAMCVQILHLNLVPKGVYKTRQIESLSGDQ